MTPLKAIACMIDRDKHKAEQARKLKENYGRFRAKVVRDVSEVPRSEENDDQGKRI